MALAVAVRKLAAALNELQKQQHASPELTFAAAIAPAERAVGDLLTGPARTRCEIAFDVDEAAFAVLVNKFVEKARTGRARSLGLLLRLVEDEHAAISERLSEEGVSPIVPRCCESCGIGGGLHTADCERVRAA